MIGFVEGNFSTKYLGAMLFSRRMMTRMLDPLVLKIQNKVATWK